MLVRGVQPGVSQIDGMRGGMSGQYFALDKVVPAANGEKVFGAACSVLSSFDVQERGRCNSAAMDPAVQDYHVSPASPMCTTYEDE